MLITNRRQLLKSLAAIPFLRLLEPAFSYAQGAGSNKNLILINLGGGFDAFNAFPYLQDPNVGNQAQGFVQFLRDNRPDTFMLPQNNLLSPTTYYMANGYLGFAPAWAPIMPEFSQGNIKLIQSIGIDPQGLPNGSHNFCENCYTFANKNYVGGVNRAWFARLIESMNLVHNQAFSFGTLGRADFVTIPPVPAPLVGMRTESIVWQDPLGSSRQNLNIQTARQLLALAQTSAPAQEKIKESLGQSLDAVELMNTLNQATNPGGPKALVGNYPLGGPLSIGPTLKSVGRVISYFQGDGQNRLFYGFQGGWDTHQNQGGFDLTTGAPQGTMHVYLGQVASALRALIDDLKAPSRYAWDKTIIVVFSEFNRTARQNGSMGTDHGAGSTFMVLGGPVQGGVLGVAPTVTSLTQLNCYYPTVAFQNLFAPLVNWFGASDTDIFSRDLYLRDEAIAGAILSAGA